MKLYLDLIFIINIWFDFLILLTVAILLKRNIKIKRIILGSLFGGLTFFILFFKLNTLELMIYKVIVSIFMCLITFSFKNIKYSFSNLSYFYLVSIILGGGMYLLNDSFVTSNGLVFKNNFDFNYLFLFILSPIIIFIYIKQSLKLKNNYSNYHKVDILYKNKLYRLNGYLDTGNNLFDPYKKRNIILVKLNLNYSLEDVIYTPYESLNNVGVIKCLCVDKIYVDQKEFKNYLIGLSNDKFRIEGINCILHNSMKGEL
ncbi:MAG: sigma-E processing peptidase SpoIIGA [Bacilli bacterium]